MAEEEARRGTGRNDAASANDEVVDTVAILTGHDNRASSSDNAYDGLGAILDMASGSHTAIRQGSVNIRLSEILRGAFHRDSTTNGANKAYIQVRTGRSGGVGAGDIIVASVTKGLDTSFTDAEAAALMNLRAHATIPHHDRVVTAGGRPVNIGSTFTLVLENIGIADVASGARIQVNWKAV